MKSLYLSILAVFSLGYTSLSETIPAAPTKYLDDRVNALKETDAKLLNLKLQKIEQLPGNPQFIISILKFDTNSTIEDYCNRIANTWKVGQKDKNNGLILFWFPETRKIRWEIGYGLEGAIPDSLSARISKENIIPRFKANDYAGGLNSAVDRVANLLNKEVVVTQAASNQSNNESGGLGFIFLLTLGFGGLVIAFFVFRKKEEPLPLVSSVPTYTPPVVPYTPTPIRKRVIAAAPIIPVVSSVPKPSLKSKPRPKYNETKPSKRKSSDYDYGSNNSNSGGISSGSSWGDSGSSSGGFDSGGGSFGGGGSSDSY